MQKVSLLLSLLLMTLITAEAQERVGLVVGITGTGRLKSTSGNVQKLNEQNFSVSLSDGQSVKADGNGTVRIRLCNGRSETVGNKWFRISRVICMNATNPEKRKILERIFAFGGRYQTNRSSDEFLLFPVEKGTTVIRPETVVFRWREAPEKITLSVYVAGQSAAIWSKEVDAGSKQFFSDELKIRLEEIRQKQPNVKLQLRLSSPFFGTENIADFQMFSLQDEEVLQNEISQTNAEHGTFRHLARAEIYARHKLYIEMASEYEAALKLSPDSIELRSATASAHDRSGNFYRRDEVLTGLR